MSFFQGFFQSNSTFKNANSASFFVHRLQHSAVGGQIISRMRQRVQSVVQSSSESMAAVAANGSLIHLLQTFLYTILLLILLEFPNFSNLHSRVYRNAGILFALALKYRSNDNMSRICNFHQVSL